MTVPPDGTQAQIGRLPDRHLAALRAALAGFDDADIAMLLGIPVESVHTTLRLAAAKLARVLSDPARPSR
jgi:DNA-directed RNA polymerase specialized sigma24 family protein